MLEIFVHQNGENKYLDVLPDTQFTVSYSIANINDISASNGAYSKTITIPDTANNRMIFGFVTDMSVDLGYNFFSGASYSFNPNKRLPCIVLEDTVTVLEGYIQVTKFTYDEGVKLKTLECNIFADNANFWQSMGDDLISDIDFSEFSFTYSTTFVQSTWNNDVDAYKKGTYFPLIDYGAGWTLDDLNNNNKHRLGLSDFKPAVFAKTILDKIFATHGYNVSSKFLGSVHRDTVVNPDPRFSNLIIPYNSQTFQTGPLFNQDKIFHVGLTPTTIGQYGSYSFGQYSGYSDMWPGSIHNAWYTGYLLSPFQFYFDRNTGVSFSTYQYAEIDLPFGNTASPMFDPVVNGQPMYDTSIPANNYYVHTTASLFKQRFVLKTDVVTTYSINGGYNDSTRYFTHSFAPPGPTPPALKYVMYINFYREFDPVTGTANPAWLGGTGSIIPPDLGFQNSGTSYSIAQDFFSHWICDENGKSNVFCDGGTKLVVPLGDSRYLGKYCTDYTGGRAFEADGSDGALFASQSYYKNDSGNCKTWYYNDGWSSTEVGLWTSGDLPFYNLSTNTPQFGDWYQGLVLQTIYLDGDPLDPYYGPSGTVMPYGNTPLFEGEKVRCVAYLGGKFEGDATNTLRSLESFMPPTSAYLLTYTNFFNDAPFPYGTYQNPISRNQPLTQFYNDVSNDYIAGMRVNFNDCIPKNIKQRDFLMDIINMHNLYIEPDKNNPNTLIIEPREDYYALATQSLDWTSKIDLTTPVDVQILAETQNKRTTFTYKDDKDWYNKEYTQLTNEKYGQFVFNLDNDFLTGEKKVEISTFSPTPLVQLYSFLGDSTGDSLTEQGGFIIPVIVSGTNQKPSTTETANGTAQYNYRILYKNYIENQNRDQIYLFGAFTHSYPYAGPYDNPYNPTYSINFGQSLGEFFNEATDGVTDNLVNVYWANLLTELTDMDSRIITVSMYLTPYDISTFYFYKMVYLEIDGVGGYYKVNSIEDYTPGQNSVCKVTLLKSNVT